MTSVPHTEPRIATAEELIGDSVRVVELDNGRRVKVRKVCKDELAAHGLASPAVALPLAKSQSAGISAEARQMLQQKAAEEGARQWPGIVDGVLALGMVEPRGYLGDPAQCPEGAVPVRFLGAHRDQLFDAIYHASGGADEITAAAAAFRRGARRGGSPAAAGEMDGEEADPSPEAGDR